MIKVILCSFLILLLVPISVKVFLQEYTDTTSTLTVLLSKESPFVYRDSDGYTVVVGIS